jgi:hypothetical protein
MDQEHTDYADGPPRRGDPPSLRDVGCCLLVVLAIASAVLLALYRAVMTVAHD